MARWLVFGDSHIAPFRKAVELGLLPPDTGLLEVRGATAMGLANRQSVTGALERFEAGLLPPRPGSLPVMQLGEVDCGFVIWYRAEKHHLPVADQMEKSIERYFAFADRLLAAGYPGVVITGATVPTIRDGQDWGEVAHLRREVQTTLVARTQLTLAYNARLRQGAAARGLPFVCIADQVLDPATGVVKDFYRRKNPLNHHLHAARAAELWAAALNALPLPALLAGGKAPA
ncbi:hypothetical protein [Pseudoxanthobacter sp.]|uniref:hypothetical protein n=1 Tax=Pseudoxanthobacter sp. TaxID=1925742 RepID=UPI002FE08BEA